MIEKLFKLLESTKSKYEFRNYLNILKYHAEVHDISLLEVHQRVSHINNLLWNYDEESWESSEFQISQLLLTLSCFEREFSYIIEKKICFKSDIEEAFEEKVEDFDKTT